MAAKSSEKWLVFIDTNILLDFYRLGGESAARQLAALDRHRGSIITNDQVRMEFFKNRQKVIADSLGKMQKPNRVSLPPILAEFEPAKTMQAALDEAVKAHGLVRDKIEAIVGDPEHHDPVFKELSRLFATPSPLNLSSSHAKRGEVHTLARERFALGYPPRKSTDNSCGDAINWEWIIACAKQVSGCHVLIVSRDSDYGLTTSEASTLNDWLKLEFTKRVGPKRKIELTARLTTALKRLEEHVSAEDEKEESRLLADLPRFDLERDGLQSLRSAVRERDGVPSWFSDLIAEAGRIQDGDPAGPK